VLPPGAHDHRRQDREQGRRFRVHLREPEHEYERRHEQDPPADPEQTGKDAAEQAENDSENVHQRRRRIATAVSRSEKPIVNVRVWSRCCRETPPIAPTAAGSPINAAEPILRSPWSP